MKPNMGSGDDGKTNLIGKRVWKDHLRVEINGNIDELNSFLGLANSKINYDDIKQVILDVQNKLFLIGSIVAYYSDKKIKKEDIDHIEKMIFEFEKELDPLKKFIIPFGEEACLLHICRSKCRNVERLIVKLSKKEKIDKEILSYLNRLSDLLFILSRLVNKRKGIKEIEW
ncbi:MAG: cob(I)yrinic acid a,c-diamide adenosyltransferase [Candidatus Aenigmatarchaeota archaeon]